MNGKDTSYAITGEKSLVRGAGFIKMAASQRQYVGFQDIDHGVPEIWEELAKEENMKALAAAGVKHLFTELERRRQYEVDKFYQGKVSEADIYAKADTFDTGSGTEEDKHRQGMAMANMIVLAKKYGMQVHFADPDSKVFSEENEIPLLREEHNLYKSDPEAGTALNKMKLLRGNIDRMLEYKLSLPPDLQERVSDLSKKAGQAKFEERYTMNKELAEFIETTSAGEKAAILYGAGHFDQLKDLDEYLDMTTVTFLCSLTAYPPDTGEKTLQELPDYAYFIDEQRAVQKQTVCEVAAQAAELLKDSGVQLCEHTLDMGTYHRGSIKEEVQIKR